MSFRALLVLLTLVAGALSASLGAPRHASLVTIEVVELPSGDSSADARAALTRGGFAMAAVESSRRKPRAGQRPPADALTLTHQSLANALARFDAQTAPSAGPPVKLARPERPFLARGPPTLPLA